MKYLFLLLLPIASLAQQFDYYSEQEFFDDFSYTSSSDSRIASFGWDLMNRPGWPGYQAPVMYSADNIVFTTDPENSENTIMEVSTQTTNNLADRSFARIQYSQFLFLHGTYAARVKFDNIPAQYGDGNVQTFYAIMNAEASPAHAEIDFEYLPYDVWGGGNTNNAMYLTTWESYVNEPWSPVKAYDVYKDDYADQWHTVIFTAKNNEVVNYTIDGVSIASHTVADQDGTTSVYPDSKMQVAFANWIWSNASTGIGSSTDLRKSTLTADWIYHSKNTDLLPTTVESIVEQLKKDGIERHNTMQSSDPATVGFLKAQTSTNETNITFQSHFESGVTSYELEYSSDGISYVLLNTYTANNDDRINNYEFTDTQHSSGYYRVKTTSGAASVYTEAIFVDASVTSIRKENELDIMLFPNPSSEGFQTNQLANIRIYNMQAQMIDELTETSNFGHGLEPGVYSCIISIQDKSTVRKIVKQ